ncbi:MAG: hypothetical protein OEW05_07875 [Candidatus Aminicenantes bacterium]|nr:hypothetical protein [Candidatus Aminicenantes bacterium]
MRKAARFILLAFLVAVPVRGQVKFLAPTVEAARFGLAATFDIPPGNPQFKGLRLNGQPFVRFQAFRNGKTVDLAKPLAAGPLDFLLDYAWSGAKKYVVTVLYQLKEKERRKEFSAVSPAGGVPAGCEEGFSRVYVVQEEAGLAREGEIAYLTLTAPRADVENAAFRYFDGAAELPYQVIDRRESFPPESQAKTHPPTLTYKLAVALDAGAWEKKLIAVFKGTPKPPAAEIALSGEGLGRTVRSDKLVLGLHPQSGQLNTFEDLTTGVKLYNKAGVIHWNPDVFIPGIAWDHSFDWKPPAVTEEKNGPLVYLNARSGPMPRIKDVDLEVRYAVPVGAPYLVCETRLTFEKDLGVIAVRNDEMVLYKELFDSLLYRDKNGALVKLPLRELRGRPFGLVHIAPDDVPWVGLVNTKAGYGFFSLRLAAASSDLGVAGDFQHKAGTYFYAPSDGEYVYWVRPLLYTWAEYATNTLLTFVPRGSFCYEKNAYLVLKLDDGTPEALDTLRRRLSNPLRVF